MHPLGANVYLVSLEMRHNTLTVRVINHLNNLLKSMVDSPLLKIVKSNLDLSFQTICSCLVTEYSPDAEAMSVWFCNLFCTEGQSK